MSTENSVIIVIGSGPSNIDAIRGAESTPSNWWLANERGVGGQHDRAPVEDTWCVVLPDDGSVSREELDADPAVATYETIPEDSPALAQWRAS